MHQFSDASAAQCLCGCLIKQVASCASSSAALSSGLESSLVDRTTNLRELGPSQLAVIGAHRESNIMIGVLSEWDYTLVSLSHSKGLELQMYVCGV
jgi:hypothetical protein